MKNIKTWFSEQFATAEKKPVPVLSFPSIQLMDITVHDLILDADTQAEGMRLIAERCNTGASVTLMDLSVEAEAFGSEILYTDDEVPNVVGALIGNIDEARALAVPAVGAGRTGIYIDVVKKVLEKITDRPVFSGTIGPFSLAGRLSGMAEIIVRCRRDPEMVHILLQKTTDFLIAYIKAYKAAGAHGVVIAEPAAGLLSPSLMGKFSSPYCKQIVDAVQDETFAVIYHNCGPSVNKATTEILSTGAAAYHFGDTADLAALLPQYPSDVLVMGNVDPVSHFFSGTPESVREATLKLMEECSAYPNFIPSSGCDIPPTTKWENIDAFFSAIEEFYAARREESSRSA